MTVKFHSKNLQVRNIQNIKIADEVSYLIINKYSGCTRIYIYIKLILDCIIITMIRSFLIPIASIKQPQLTNLDFPPQILEYWGKLKTTTLSRNITGTCTYNHILQSTADFKLFKLDILQFCSLFTSSIQLYRIKHFLYAHSKFQVYIKAFFG